MNKGAKFLLKYRLIANSIALGIGAAIYVLMTLIFNIGNILQGNFFYGFWQVLLGGLTGTAMICGIVMLFVLPRRTFNIANQFGIDRKTLWWTDIFTPIFWTIVLLVFGLITQLVSHGSGVISSSPSGFWFGIVMILAMFFSFQVLADLVALVHGFWKVIVVIGVPTLLMALLIWIMVRIAEWMSKTDWTLSPHQLDQMQHVLINPGTWSIFLVIFIAIMIFFTWLCTKFIRLQRD